jgi:transcriptional regulator with XRE-family HTH domain
MAIEFVHIGTRVAQKLGEKHMTKRDLADAIGMTPGNAVYLTTRETMDVKTLHKIGIALKYNFFKLFPVEEDTSTSLSTGAAVMTENEKMIGDLKNKIAEQEKIIADLKRDLEMQKKENGYLAEINGLLRKK